MTRPGAEFESHLRDWLDDDLVTSAECDASLEAAKQAADEILIHGLLRDRCLHDSACDEQRIRAVMEAIKIETRQQPVSAEPRRRSRRLVLVWGVASLAACLLLVVTLHEPNPASAAMISLEKIIEVAQRRVDRSYRLDVVEEYDRDKRPRHLPSPDGRRSPDTIDGALLHVRGPGEFVFVRRTPDGQERISGCDGKESWAFREEGPVHVSADLSRFRGGLPGEQQDLPFVNLHTHLQQLRAGYDVELRTSTVKASDGRTLSELIASRKSSDVRGPKSVELWFDARTGVVYRMLLDGLPRRGGGPKSVSLELLDPENFGQTDFGPSFFSHDSHHESLREVRDEEAR